MKRADEGTKQMFKTSISLPESLLSIWAKRRALVEKLLPGLLARYAQQSPRRDRLVQYIESLEPCGRVSVYWPIATYNELHSVASSLRISVSHLLCLIIQFMEAGDLAKKIFLKYVFKVKEWSRYRMHWTEILEFSPDNPDPP